MTSAYSQRGGSVSRQAAEYPMEKIKVAEAAKGGNFLDRLVRGVEQRFRTLNSGLLEELERAQSEVFI